MEFWTLIFCLRNKEWIYAMVTLRLGLANDLNPIIWRSTINDNCGDQLIFRQSIFFSFVRSRRVVTAIQRSIDKADVLASTLWKLCDQAGLSDHWQWMQGVTCIKWFLASCFRSLASSFAYHRSWNDCQADSRLLAGWLRPRRDIGETWWDLVKILIFFIFLS